MTILMSGAGVRAAGAALFCLVRESAPEPWTAGAGAGAF